MSKVYKHWSQFPMSEWRWPSFSPQEMASKGEGELMIDEASMDKLQKLRDRLGKPMLITSAYRSEAHNNKVGGVPTSQHRLAKAYDVIMTNHDPHQFEAMAKAVGFTGFGHYPKSNFMHIDTGPARRWNDGSDFPKTSTSVTPDFQSEPKRPTITDIVTKPEVMVGVGGVLSGAGAVTQGSGPVQFAIGAVLVLAAVAIAAVIITRLIRRPRDV